MSTNQTRSLAARASVRKLEALLPSLNKLRGQVFNHEELAALEGGFLSWFESKLEGHKEFSELRAGSRPAVEDFRQYQDEWATDYLFASIELKELTERYLQYENARQLEVAALESHLRRSQQKLAAISLWQGKQPRGVFNTMFHTYDGLSPKNLTSVEMSYDFAGGQATLPVLSEKKQSIKAIRILPGSNGFPGNSNVKVSNQDNNPYYAINTDDNDWFEYERLDEGPVKLALALDLAAPTLINRLDLKFVEQLGANSIFIEDIKFLTPGGSVSIETLVGEQPESFYSFQSKASFTEWPINFLPVQATTIFLTLSSKSSSVIEDTNGFQRKRFAIGLKSIVVKTCVFDSKGCVASSARRPASAFLAAPVIRIWPSDFNLYTPTYEYSLNQSGDWSTSDIDLLDPGKQSTILLQGNESAFEWRLTLERQDKAFQNATSFSKQETITPELGTMLTSVSRFASPANVVLSEKPKDGRVFAMQPQLGQVTDGPISRFVLGVTTGKTQLIHLPVNVFDMYDFVDDAAEFGIGLRLQVGGELLTVNAIGDTPTVGTAKLAKDGQGIYVNYAVPGLEITLALPGERLELSQKADGYYHTMRGLFDPDKDRIRVFYEPLTTKVAGIVIPQGKKFLKLADTDIDYGSLQITNLADGSSWGSKKSSYGGMTTGGDWYVDLARGVLYLFEPLDAGQQLQLGYRADSLVELSKDDFEIVLEGQTPKGIRISTEALQARQVFETVDTGRPLPGSVKAIARRDIRNGVVSELDDTVVNGYRLSYDLILPGSIKAEGSSFLSSGLSPVEIPYIDGVSEFSGLRPSTNEITVYLEAPPSGIVSFKLAARDLWVENAGIVFGDKTVFKNKVALGSVSATVGNYNVASDGTVTLNVGPNQLLQSGIRIHYLYRDPDFDPTNKYSVNYAFGSLHSSVGIVTGSKISYRVARYKVWYDLAQEVSDTKYDPGSQTLSVKTETMNEKNGLLRLVWNKGSGDPTLEKYASYFSPLLFQVGHVLQ